MLLTFKQTLQRLFSIPNLLPICLTRQKMSKVCLITGGTQGIGRATAELLARQGWRVVVSGRNVQNGQKVVETIKNGGGEATFVEGDMCSREDISALHKRIIAVYGRLDAAVNNAGTMNDFNPFTDLSSDKFERMWQVNVLGLFWCMQEQIRLMAPQKLGHIVNMSSAAGLHGTPGGATYAATKHAVVGLTRSAAAEYAQAGLYITSIAPGVIKTDILDGMIKDGPMTEESLSEMMPVKKIGDPAEIARAVSFLLGSEFTTGSVLEVDGGVGAT